MKPDHLWRILGSAVLVVTTLFVFTPLIGSSRAPSQAFAQEAAKPSRSVYLPIIKSGNPTVLTSGDWLASLNSYRSLSGLPAVSENPGWSMGSQNHSRYIVKNDRVEHTEEVGNPWYTPEGKAAAESGNLMASTSPSTTDNHAIDSWMQAPFHALGILDPALNQVGFGSYREANGNLQMGATLDILRGLGPVPQSVTFPVMWPGNGVTISLGSFYGEYPDPLSSCPGYAAPSGLPLILQIGEGSLTPNISAASFKRGGTALEHCVFSETTYVNSNANAQDVGRTILGARDAIILIPRQPLRPASTYTVSITANGQTYTWSFSTAGTLNIPATDVESSFQ